MGSGAGHVGGWGGGAVGARMACGVLLDWLWMVLSEEGWDLGDGSERICEN